MSENEKKILEINFKPGQKKVEVNGVIMELPKYVGLNARSYVLDINRSVLMKICFECKKRSDILKYDFEKNEFMDVHYESETHFQGQSGFKTRCVECDDVYKLKKKEVEREEWLQIFSSEGILASSEKGNPLIALNEENKEFIKAVALKKSMTDEEFLNHSIDAFKRANNYRPMFYEDNIE
jgi:hypothetical protein